MGISVHVVDATIATDSTNFDSLASVGSGDMVLKIGAMCNGNEQIISDIKRRCRRGSISRLIIYGHGAPGVQAMTGRDGSGTHENSGLAMSVLTNPGYRVQWNSLTPYFATDGVIVLRGCNTAQGQKGKDLITELAKTVGVPVQASDWYQRVGKSDLLGNIKTAYPSGAIVDDEAQGKRHLQDLPLVERVLFRTLETFFDAKD